MKLDDDHMNITKRSVHEKLRIKTIFDSSIKNLPYSHQSLINVRTCINITSQYFPDEQVQVNTDDVFYNSLGMIICGQGVPSESMKIKLP